MEIINSKPTVIDYLKSIEKTLQEISTALKNKEPKIEYRDARDNTPKETEKATEPSKGKGRKKTVKD